MVLPFHRHSEFIAWLRRHWFIIFKLSSLTLVFTAVATWMLLVAHRLLSSSKSDAISIGKFAFNLEISNQGNQALIALVLIVVAWSMWSSLIALVIHYEFRKHFLRLEESRLIPDLSQVSSESRRGRFASAISERILLRSVLTWISALIRTLGISAVLIKTVGIPALGLILIWGFSAIISSRRFEKGQEINARRSSARENFRNESSTNPRSEMVEVLFQRDRFLTRLTLKEMALVTTSVIGLLLLPIWINGDPRSRGFQSLIVLMLLVSLVRMLTAAGSVGFRVGSNFDGGILDDEAEEISSDVSTYSARKSAWPVGAYSTAPFGEDSPVFLVLQGGLKKIGDISTQLLAGNIAEANCGFIFLARYDASSSKILGELIGARNPIVLICAGEDINQNLGLSSKQLIRRIVLSSAPNEVSSSGVRPESYLRFLSEFGALTEIARLWSDPSVTDEELPHREEELLANAQETMTDSSPG